MIAIPYQYKQGEIFNNKAEIHIQDDLTPELFDERYPGYIRFFNYNHCAYYWKEIKYEYN